MADIKEVLLILVSDTWRKRDKIYGIWENYVHDHCSRFVRKTRRFIPNADGILLNSVSSLVFFG